MTEHQRGEDDPRTRPDLPAGIVVGVADRTIEVERALWEAALWAARREVDITLVTAVRHSHTCRLSSAERWAEQRQRALRRVDGAAHRVARCTDVSRRIHTAVVEGSAGDALVSASESASLIVLQRRELGPVARMAADSTTATVSAHAACPVLVVHAHDQIAVGNGLMVVLDGQLSVQASLGEAFAEAARRGGALTVAVLLRPAAAYHGGGSSAWWASVGKGDRLAAWQTRFPQVRVSEVAVDRIDVSTLLRMASERELVIVARRRRGTTTQHDLGAVVRRLIEEAQCPVLVLPAGPQVEWHLDASAVQEQRLRQNDVADAAATYESCGPAAVDE